MSIIKHTRFLLLITLIALIIFGYHPMYFNNEGEYTGNGTMSYVLITLTAIVILSIADIWQSWKYSEIKVYTLSLVATGIVILGLYAFGFIKSLMEIRTLTIPLIALIIGASSEYSHKQILLICCTYIIMSIYVGLMQIYTNIGGFEILDAYLTNAKNSFGPILCIAGVMSLLVALTTHIPNTLRILLALCSIVIFVEILTIRARFASITYISISSFVIFKYLKQSNKNISLVRYIIAIVIIYCIVYYLSDYFIDSFTRNREDDITSGRGEVIVDSIDIFTISPLWGNLTLNRDIGWVHNYFFLKLSSYGIIGSLPWMFLYFYLAVSIIKGLFNANLLSPYHYGWAIILVSFITSLAEPTYPYGPGTTNFIPFLLFGVALSNKIK